MVKLRHGLVIVGESDSGKSEVIAVLKGALLKL